MFTPTGLLSSHTFKISSLKMLKNQKNDRASNTYLTAFVCLPENRAAPIVSHPNPLAIPSVLIISDKTNPLKVRSKQTVIDGIGLSFLKLLQKEYGNKYREGCAADEARQAMEKVSPHLAKHDPKEAIAAGKKQFEAYL
ncbi:hypothetical protein GALMADRAFT_1155045 [Galerina marginata CBS 339.88]|uniref:Uncharacterized protein n=1 Tax=Galerina marginata (strain CBS 339.88) TaxID=685588 RepID=A0A067S6L8_GALM3|nr:hypothetical protein GALMADRAFT_1155045 [Galerina marginata CBS 339.88]